ncbi:recombinase family protein [Streptococcus suis]|nr:recombinase family protein [Streptococcus suis]
MVNRILTNRVYTGTLEQGKQTKLNYKSQKSVAVSPDDWVRVEDTHEAIISKSIFAIANNLLLRDVKHGKKLPDLFAGLLFCSDCQAQLVQRKLRYKDKETVQYICSTYNNGRGCSRHAMKQEMVLDLVSTIIHQHLNWKSYLIKAVPDYLNQEQFLEVDFTSLLANRKKYEQLIQSLYLDLDDGLINDTEYQEFQRCYRQKLNQIKDAIIQKKALAQTLYDKLKDKKRWLKQLSENQKDKELNRFTLVTLLDRIVIHENQELTLVFHDMAELEILQQFSHKETEVI